MTPIGYQISDGVRRSVVAREAGRTDIEAMIIVAGQPDTNQAVALVDLYTNKDVIQRDYRYIRDNEYPLVTLGTEPPRIVVRPLYNVKALSYLTAIPNVRLV